MLGSAVVVGLGVGVALVAALPKRAYRRIVVSMVVSISVVRFVVGIGELALWVRRGKVVLVWCVRWFGVVGAGGWSE